MSASDALDEIHALIQADDYSAAATRIVEARATGHTDALISLFEAICVYEAGDDVETLRLIAEFLASSERPEKRPYALFTAALCLNNLGLIEQSLELLAKVPASYPDICEAQARSTKELKDQKQGLQFFSVIRNN